MNVPEGVIESLIFVVGGFFCKVIFGLIGKNEKKSEEEDRRLEEEIKDLRAEMKDNMERTRQNEHKIFDRVGNAERENSYAQGYAQGYERGKSEHAHN